MHFKIKNIKNYCEVFIKKGPRDAPPPSQEYEYLQRQKFFCRESGNPPPPSRRLMVYYKANRNVMDRRCAHDCRYQTCQSTCFEPISNSVPIVGNELTCSTTHIAVKDPVSSISRLSLNLRPNYLGQTIVSTGYLYEGGSS